jgi:hypothetical protein
MTTAATHTCICYKLHSCQNLHWRYCSTIIHTTGDPDMALGFGTRSYCTSETHRTITTTAIPTMADTVTHVAMATPIEAPLHMQQDPASCSPQLHFPASSEQLCVATTFSASLAVQVVGLWVCATCCCWACCHQAQPSHQYQPAAAGPAAACVLLRDPALPTAVQLYTWGCCCRWS